MSRLEKIRALMSERNIDAVIVSSPINQSYVSGFDYTDGYVLIFPDTAILVADFRYVEAAEKSVDRNEFEVVMSNGSVLGFAGDIILDKKSKRVAFEEISLSVSLFSKLHSHLGKDVTLMPCASEMLEKLRAVKDRTEIEKITRAQSITDLAFNHILKFIKPDMTEREVALELEYFMRRNGASGMAFDVIAVSGEASSLPHGVPRNKKLEKGFLTMDFGAMAEGYCSDMTRTVVVGHADSEMKSLYNTVLKAQNEALDIIRAGVGCRQADKGARDIIDSAGYEGCFGHSLGHGVGKFIHENPRLSPSAAEGETLVVGNVVTVEPGIYIGGKYGCRIEDMIAITENGVLNFTSSPKELIEII